MLLKSYRAWRRRRTLRRHSIQDAVWEQVVDATPLLRGLTAERLNRLRDYATLFVYEKDFYGVDDLEIDAKRAAMIAASACLPVLELGFEWLDGWHSIFVYPGQFRTQRQFRDELGLEGVDDRALAGEASMDGGLVLSWVDVVEDLAAGNDGQNVVIHEIAHKLDMLNGDADGYPPLHRSMSSRAWATSMQQAFADLSRRVERDQDVPIDPYAATNPAEFFAVTSEYFFEWPEALIDAYPDVFDLLQQFYRPVSVNRATV